MYYIEQDSKIVLFEASLEVLKNTLDFMPQYKGLEIKESAIDIVEFDGQFYFVDDESYLIAKAQKEAERIKSLSMTRSDFFDGTIKAFFLTQEKLKSAIESILVNLDINEIDKTIAMNNYDNALNFYRKHPLFDLLSGLSIPISETQSIMINAEQWDKFFDETSKKNPEAYKELLPM